MKIQSALIATLCLSGCTTLKTSEQNITTVTQPYVLVTAIDDETCYIRYLGSYALDSVCTRGSDIRYSPTAVDAGRGRAIPVHVAALFEKTPVQDILETRRIEQAKLLSLLETAPR